MLFKKIAEVEQEIPSSVRALSYDWEHDYMVSGPPTHYGFEDGLHAFVFPSEELGLLILALSDNDIYLKQTCPAEYETDLTLEQLETVGIPTHRTLC